MSSYSQEIYDAVRSKIHGGSVDQAIAQAVRDMNLGFYFECAAQELAVAAQEQMRPSVLMKPKLFVDGDHWCALYGDDLQNGMGAFGKSPAQAMRNFDEAWNKYR